MHGPTNVKNIWSFPVSTQHPMKMCTVVGGVRAVLWLVWRMIGYLLWPPLSLNKIPEIYVEAKKMGGCVVFVWYNVITSMKGVARNRNAVITLVGSRSGEWGRPKWDLKQLNPGIGAYAAYMAKIQRQTDTLSIFIFRNRFAVWLTVRWLMSYTYGAPILDVSRSHTTTQHSR